MVLPNDETVPPRAPSDLITTYLSRASAVRIPKAIKIKADQAESLGSLVTPLPSKAKKRSQ